MPLFDLISIVCLFLFFFKTVYVEKTDRKTTIKPTAEDLFKAVLSETRLHQVNAMKNILQLQNYEKQYMIADKSLTKIHEVILWNKPILESSDYIPGLHLPNNNTVYKALAQIVDNTAMYGEFQLKLPDITDRIIRKNPNWLVIIKWAISFSNSTGLYDVKTMEMIDLLCQEMNLIEREEHFINPYRKYNAKEETYRTSTYKKKKTKKPKGPQLSRIRYGEL